MEDIYFIYVNGPLVCRFSFKLISYKNSLKRITELKKNKIIDKINQTNFNLNVNEQRMLYHNHFIDLAKKYQLFNLNVIYLN